MWFDIKSSLNMIAISRAWWNQRTRFFLAANPWATVKGPLGATIGALDTMGWNPITPFKWIDPNGHTWVAEGETSPIVLIEEIEQQLDKLIWATAAHHRNGNGLEDGVDLTVVRRFIAKLKNEEIAKVQDYI